MERTSVYFGGLIISHCRFTLSVKSRTQRGVALSFCAAELDAACDAAMTAAGVRSILEQIFSGNVFVIELHLESQSALIER